MTTTTRPLAPPTVGALLRQYRLRRGLSQVALATALGMHEMAYGHQELDRAQPSRACLAALGRALRLREHEQIALLLAVWRSGGYGRSGPRDDTDA